MEHSLIVQDMVDLANGAPQMPDDDVILVSVGGRSSRTELKTLILKQSSSDSCQNSDSVVVGP
jgi:hypothetical protein